MQPWARGRPWRRRKTPSLPEARRKEMDFLVYTAGDVLVPKCVVCVGGGE